MLALGGGGLWGLSFEDCGTSTGLEVSASTLLVVKSAVDKGADEDDWEGEMLNSDSKKEVKSLFDCRDSSSALLLLSDDELDTVDVAGAVAFVTICLLT